MTATGLRVKIRFIPSLNDIEKYREAKSKIDENDFLKWILEDTSSPEIDQARDFKNYFVQLFVTYFKPTYYKVVTLQGYSTDAFEFKCDVEYDRKTFNDNVFDFKTITDGELTYEIVRELL